MKFEGWKYFDRERLRSIRLLKTEDGKFFIVTHILDRDSLNISRIFSCFSEETLKHVIAMYLDKFTENNTLRL